MDDFTNLIPRKIKDWRAVGKDAIYDRKTLYDYMDGGAEVYLAFDFQQVFVRKYKGPNNDEITLDIYDMGSSEEAFGIFSCDREDDPAGIGQNSEYGFGLLRFWQGRYFVTATATGNDKEAEPVILELGRNVAKQINDHGEMPGLLSILPKKSLKPMQTSYFHSIVSLNNRFFIASENILNLSRRTNCVFAEYAGEGDDLLGYLLIVKYADEKLAEEAFQSFLVCYMPEADERGVVQTESKNWTLAGVHGTYVSIVFEASSLEWGEELQSAVKYTSR